jgi:kynurenine 3-monooxygenase
MDKRAIHLVDKLNFQNYGQERSNLFHFKRDSKSKNDQSCRRSEIFFNQKIWDVTLKEATLHMGESEKRFGKKKIRYVFGADGAFSRIRHRKKHV